ELKNKPGHTLEAAINEVIGLSYNSDMHNAIAVNEEKDKYLEALHSFVAQQNKYFENYQEALQKKDDQIDRLESLISSLIENNSENAPAISEESKMSPNEPKKIEKKQSLFKKIFG
ncbi:hypothetical protein SAMN05878443_2438, partial [Carnobacterium alterfunditum]